MTVGELRRILENEIIDDELIIYDYDEQTIRDVNLTINANGECTEIHFGMEKK